MGWCYHVTRMTMLKELAREYWANRPMELAAALSYYTLLSLAPLVLMTVAVAWYRRPVSVCGEK